MAPFVRLIKSRTFHLGFPFGTSVGHKPLQLGEGYISAMVSLCCWLTHKRAFTLVQVRCYVLVLGAGEVALTGLMFTRPSLGDASRFTCFAPLRGPVLLCLRGNLLRKTRLGFGERPFLAVLVKVFGAHRQPAHGHRGPILWGNGPNPRPQRKTKQNKWERPLFEACSKLCKTSLWSVWEPETPVGATGVPTTTMGSGAQFSVTAAHVVLLFGVCVCVCAFSSNQASNQRTKQAGNHTNMGMCQNREQLFMVASLCV